MDRVRSILLVGCALNIIGAVNLCDNEMKYCLINLGGNSNHELESVTNYTLAISKAFGMGEEVRVLQAYSKRFSPEGVWPKDINYVAIYKSATGKRCITKYNHNCYHSDCSYAVIERPVCPNRAGQLDNWLKKWAQI